MKKSTGPKTSETKKENRGIALVTILAVLSLAAVLIMAFFSLTRNELTSSTQYSHGLEAQQLSQTAINIVMHQIRNATDTAGVAWASQPGMIRTWTPSEKKGYKLYSDDEMVITLGGSELERDAEEMKVWDEESYRGIYTDLNEPVVRGEKVHYPIADPRAWPQGPKEKDQWTEDFDLDHVSGFYYSTNDVKADRYSRVQADHAVGLPMPVKWLYQLEDGTMGYLDSSRQFTRVSGSGTPSKENPMVSRVAFWADDETAKVNINTAAGGRPWDMPKAGGMVDRNYGESQPVQNEWQRYPGHPLTTSLLPILYPNMEMIHLARYGMREMEYIYTIIPRVRDGGSRNGNLKVRQPPLVVRDNDRLYATVDELLFQAPDFEPTRVESNLGKNGDNSDRTPNSFPALQGRQPDAEYLNKLRFFLTANSVAPETTVFNTPRISMWPSYYGDPSDGQDRLHYTAFDERMRFVAEVGKATGGGEFPSDKWIYHFQRKDSESTTFDYDGIQRNQDLYSYLQWLTEQRVPGVGKTIESKYGSQETDQILTQIFDYIRCTNLFDDNLYAGRNEDRVPPDQENGQSEFGDNTSEHLAFTNNRVKFHGGNFPEQKTTKDISTRQHTGHGQVAPIEIGDTKGFGRMYGLVEVGILFISCAEGVYWNHQDPAAGPVLRNLIGGPGTYRWRSGAQEAGDAYKHGDFKLGGGADTRLAKIQDGDRSDGYYVCNICPLPRDVFPRQLTKDTDPVLCQRLAQIYHQERSKQLDRKGDINTPGYWMAARQQLRHNADPMEPKPMPELNQQELQRRVAEWAMVTNPENWNFMLPEARPMAANEKRIQAMILFQGFCPSKGWTPINGDFQMKVKMSGPWSVTSRVSSTLPGASGGPLGFPNSEETWKSNSANFIEMPRWSMRDTGGILEPRAFIMGEHKVGNGRTVLRSRYVPGLQKDRVNVGLPYSGTPDTSDPEGIEYPWVGEGTTITYRDEETNVVDPQTGEFLRNNKRPAFMEFNGGDLEFKIYPGGGMGSDSEDPNDPANDPDSYTQGGTIAFEKVSQVPIPDLMSGARGHYYHAPHGQRRATTPNHETPGTALWTLYRDTQFRETSDPIVMRNGGRMRLSSLWRRRGLVNVDGGTQRGPATAIAGRGETFEGGAGSAGAFKSDVTLSYVIPHGDWRISHASKDTSHLWEKHKFYDDPERFIASSFVEGRSSGGYGSPSPPPLVEGVEYTNNRKPPLPSNYDMEPAYYCHWGDFDNTVATEGDGPYINKPDEGNARGIGKEDYIPEYLRYRQGGRKPVKRPFIPYFNQPRHHEPAGESFYSPNRIMPSPGMIGSLPTGVKSDEPWQTILLRPQHDIEGARNGGTHPGMEDPKDHYFLDFFWMPVVEPWSMSTPLATAGKINLNYAIQPFEHIERSSGIRCVFPSEEMLTIPIQYMKDYTANQGFGTGFRAWEDTGGRLRHIGLRSLINSEETLKQFNEKFDDEEELFISASQICEIYLVPRGINGLDLEPDLEDIRGDETFWTPKPRNPKFGLALVGDNARERPYANIYQRITTKSNTFQVHYRSQVVRQSPVSPNQPGKRRTDEEYAIFDPDVDRVTGEYRGSTIIERYIDPNDDRIPDYATSPPSTSGNNSQALDRYYRFRIVSMKRFAP